MHKKHLLATQRWYNKYLGLGSITSLVSSHRFIFFSPNGPRGSVESTHKLMEFSEISRYLLNVAAYR